MREFQEFFNKDERRIFKEEEYLIYGSYVRIGGKSFLYKFFSFGRAGGEAFYDEEFFMYRDVCEEAFFAFYGGEGDAGFFAGSFRGDKEEDVLLRDEVFQGEDVGSKTSTFF